MPSILALSVRIPFSLVCTGVGFWVFSGSSVIFGDLSIMFEIFVGSFAALFPMPTVLSAGTVTRLTSYGSQSVTRIMERPSSSFPSSM